MPVGDAIIGTVGELGGVWIFGVDITGPEVWDGLPFEVCEVDEAEDVEAVVFEGPAPVDCAAARAACLRFSLVTPTATPTMTERRMRKPRIIIAMPLFVLYQWYV